MSDLRFMILAVALAVSVTATAQETLEASYDWLSAGAKIPHSAYNFPPSSPSFHSYDYPYYPYYPYYQYSTSPRYASFPLWKSSFAYPLYPAWIGPYPGIGQHQSLGKAWWIGLQQDWMKTLSYARSQSSVLVYRNGIWQPP
jgi:hypothetical protein